MHLQFRFNGLRYSRMTMDGPFVLPGEQVTTADPNFTTASELQVNPDGVPYIVYYTLLGRDSGQNYDQATIASRNPGLNFPTSSAWSGRVMDDVEDSTWPMEFQIDPESRNIYLAWQKYDQFNADSTLYYAVLTPDLSTEVVDTSYLSGVGFSPRIAAGRIGNDPYCLVAYMYRSAVPHAGVFRITH